MASKEPTDLQAVLSGLPSLEDPELLNVARGVFEYAQYLLDDDENLTRVGNLCKPARDKLRARTLELLGATPTAEGEANEGDADAEEAE